MSEAELEERRIRDQQARQKLHERVEWSRQEAARIEKEQQQLLLAGKEQEPGLLAGLSETEVAEIIQQSLKPSRPWTEADHEARMAELRKQKAILLAQQIPESKISEPVSEPQISEPKKGEQL